MAKRKGRSDQRQPGYDGRMEAAPAIVADPYEPGKTVEVQRNIAASPLTAIFARGRLQGEHDSADDAEARYVAGQRFRALYERAEMGGARAIDYSRAKVDTSFAYRGIPESAGEAMRELAAIAKAIGDRFTILHGIIGEEVRFMAWADRDAGGQASTTHRLDCYQRLRDALDALIWHWGVAKGRASAPMRSDRLDSFPVSDQK